MSDNYESLNSKLPDLKSVIINRAKGKREEILPPPGTFDPYQMMIDRKREMDPSDFKPGPIVRWPKEDIEALEEYCKKMGIHGFKTTINPKIALAQLKRKFGDDYTGVPMEDRVPEGYERITPKYGPNNTYSEAMRKKQILHD
ncbi:MAG TPA: hypothetical protein PKX15_07055 [Bacteroidales bacterium]|nr:hypothetical protein [Bacteroidales bacterium]